MNRTELAEVRDAVGDFSDLTYTQWEAFLALHHDVRMLIYTPEDAYERVDPENDAEEDPNASRQLKSDFAHTPHLNRLYKARKHHDTYRDEVDLQGKIIADIAADLRKHLAADQLPDAFQFKPNNLPLSIGHLFKGRYEFLEEIAEKLKSGAAAITADNVAEMQKIKPTAVHGSGGIGKTRAAVEYAWQHQSAYRGLLFVNAESREALLANLSRFAWRVAN